MNKLFRAIKSVWVRWFCSEFGHKLCIEDVWIDQHIHGQCDRCGAILTKKMELPRNDKY